MAIQQQIVANAEAKRIEQQNIKIQAQQQQLASVSTRSPSPPSICFWVFCVLFAICSVLV